MEERERFIALLHTEACDSSQEDFGKYVLQNHFVYADKVGKVTGLQYGVDGWVALLKSFPSPEMFFTLEECNGYLIPRPPHYVSIDDLMKLELTISGDQLNVALQYDSRGVYASDIGWIGMYPANKTDISRRPRAAEYAWFASLMWEVHHLTVPKDVRVRYFSA